MYIYICVCVCVCVRIYSFICLFTLLIYLFTDLSIYYIYISYTDTLQMWENKVWNTYLNISKCSGWPLCICGSHSEGSNILHGHGVQCLGALAIGWRWWSESASMRKSWNALSVLCVEVTRSAPIAASFPPVALDKLGSILRTDLRRGQLLQGDPLAAASKKQAKVQPTSRSSLSSSFLRLSLISCGLRYWRTLRISKDL